MMKRLIWDSITDNIGAPVTGKDYLQNIAEAMWFEGKDLVWFTPTGLPIIQAYRAKKPGFKRVKVTVFGRTVTRKYPTYSQDLDLHEQMNGIAPNFVHSFDSAHLQLTVCAARREGMDKFLLIHDSFATDANSAARFNHIIREQFVDMYLDRDYLNEFLQTCIERVGFSIGVESISLGGFDVREVLDSEYFFA